MDRGAWWATVHGVAESDTTERRPFPFPASLMLLVQVPHLGNCCDRQEQWAGLAGGGGGRLLFRFSSVQSLSSVWLQRLCLKIAKMRPEGWRGRGI